MHNHEKEDCDVCHHKKFPEETIKEKFGDDVKTCCAGHGYIFKDNCEVINFSLKNILTYTVLSPNIQPSIKSMSQMHDLHVGLVNIENITH